MEEIYCSKCGNQYRGDLNRCPECGESNHALLHKRTFSILKYLGLGIVVGCSVASLVLSAVGYRKITELENRIYSGISGSSSYEEEKSTAVVLENYTFYDDYLLKDAELPDEEDYFIYFHSGTCSYCVAYGNSYILTYYNIPVSEDSDEYIFDSHPVYFAEMDSEEGSEIAARFSVESTPAIIRMTGGEMSAKGEGYDEVYEILGEVVEAYYTE